MRVFALLPLTLLGLLSWAVNAQELHIYGPGGPAPAMKGAAALFERKHDVVVKVTAGPAAQWKQQAMSNADVIFSGSENMMSDFVTQFPDIDPATVRPLYLRPSAILVRPGNPKKIQGVEDLGRTGLRVMVVHGAGQTGLWEDVAGRLGDIDTVRSIRRNIAMFASNSGEAKAAWEQDASFDAWLIWNIWQIANPALADVVPIEPAYRIYRDTGVALTRRGSRTPHAVRFAAFLESPEAAAFFSALGLDDACRRRPGACRPRSRQRATVVRSGVQPSMDAGMDIVELDGIAVAMAWDEPTGRWK